MKKSPHKDKRGKGKAGVIWNLETGELKFFDNKGKKYMEFGEEGWTIYNGKFISKRKNNV